jgi:hypothetical protein
MRLRLVLIAALWTALAGAAATTTTATATAPSAATPPATHSVIVRPVTSAGQPASGFHVKAQKAGSIDCSFPDASPGAVGRNIEECSPSAEYAIACWKAAEAHHALCMRDPSSRRLYRIRLMSSFAKTAVAKSKSRAPLLIVLTDGTRCSIRDGGAWAVLKSHPKWTGAYTCSRHGVVWAPPHAKHYGIDESATSWSVHTGSATGNGTLTVRHVKRAYFVGTASG